MKIYLLFIIAAILLALFSDKIDKAFNGNKKLKKVIIVFSIGIILVCTIATVANVLH